MALQPGQQIGDHHQIIEEIGKGGMSTVYSAWDTRLEREDAIKVMRPQYAEDPTFAARFKQEAQAAASLHSPHIVDIYDWNRYNGDYYIVMERLVGADLKQIIERKGAIDCKSVARIAAQVCSALSVAHANDIIHRDIKPNNIMIMKDGNVKVMDFGIAKSKNNDLTTDNSVWGTANYVSPEQVQGKPLGPTSDIYSLGVVMYEAVTGQLPFTGEDAISVALMQINDIPIPPSEVVPGVDPDLEDIILRCMEKDPSNRFQSASELRTALLNYVKGIRAGHAPMRQPTVIMNRPADAQGDGSLGVIDQPTYDEEEHVLEEGGNWFTRLATSTKAIIIGISILIVIGLGFGLSYAAGMFDSGPEMTTVPQLVGETQADAENRIKKANLEVGKVEEVWGTDDDKGKVVGQSPNAMAELAEGSKVNLQVSKGKKPVDKVQVPPLIGKTSAEARKALEDLGLVADQQQAYSDSVEEDHVISQVIDANSEVEVGTKVSYVVSLGIDRVPVPDVSGKVLDKAQSELEGRGFRVSVQYVEDDGTEGIVRNYSPEENQQKGSTITLYVTKKPEIQQVEVPNVIGYTEQGAKQSLEAAGFSVTSSTQEVLASAGYPDGTVMSYSPEGTVEKGSSIHVVIAKVKAEEPTPDTTNNTGNGNNNTGQTTGGNANNTGTNNTGNTSNNGGSAGGNGNTGA